MKQLLLISAISVTVCACGTREPSAPLRVAKGDVELGGTLRVTEMSRPESLAPDHLMAAISQRIGNQVHSGLLRLDPADLRPVPCIAERWETDSTETVYVFHLRQGAKFHPVACFGNKSREVTAHDVEFSVKRVCRPGSPIYTQTMKGRLKGAELFHTAATDRISGVTVLDDYTIRFELEKPDATFLHILAQPAMGIISQKGWDACDQLQVGAGPFMETASEPNTILVRNPDYFISDEFGNRLPYIDTVEVVYISSKELALERLLNSELDLVTGVYLDPVRTLLERNSASFTGPDARFVMQRSDDAATYEVYAIHSSKLKGFRENFLGHRDYSVVQLMH